MGTPATTADARTSRQALLATHDRLCEKRRQQQIFEFRIFGERLLDITEETAAYDAAPTPHLCDAAIVQLPTILLRSRLA